MIAKSWNLIKADWERYKEHREVNGGGITLIINSLVVKDFRMAFSFWLRILGNTRKFTPLWVLAKFMYTRLSRKYGLQISPYTKIGPGLYIGHGIGIVINEKAIIGKNCNISQFLTIGSNKGTPATIGDNVYIGPNVCIVEDVKIGNNVKIGAGTVVIHDVPDNATTVGNPNRIILKK